MGAFSLGGTAVGTVRSIAFFLLLGFMLSSAAAAMDNAQSISIVDLKRNMMAYIDEAVRVRGFINNCDSRSCNICTDKRDAQDRCVPISSWSDAPAYYVLNRLYRFSEVVLEGKISLGDMAPVSDCFSARCGIGIWNARVEQVIARYTPTDHGEKEQGPALSELKDDPDVRSLFASDPRYAKRIASRPHDYFAFAMPTREYGKSVIYGYLCWIKPGRGQAYSLLLDELVTDSLANPYVCASAVKVGNGKWEMQGHDAFFDPEGIETRSQ